MTERIVIGAAELWHGDCLEVLPMLGRFDLILTDPPYGIDYGKAGRFSASHGWTPLRENLIWDKSRPDPLIFLLMRQRSQGQIIWGGNYFTDLLPPSMRWLVWDKGQRNFSLADCEFAWSSEHKAARIFNLSRGEANLDGGQHPTQKPIRLMIWCLDMHPTARTVCDPFMGSGTTGIACAQMGKTFTGIEQDRKYFDIACRRIEDAQRQGQMFSHEQAQPCQMAIGL